MLATLQVLNNHTLPVATTLDRQKTHPSSQKVLLDSTGLVGRADTLSVFLHQTFWRGCCPPYFREEGTVITLSAVKPELEPKFFLFQNLL